MMVDLTDGEWGINDVVEYYSVPGGNVLVLHMSVVAFVAIQLAGFTFDRRLQDHAMLQALRATNDIKAVTKKFNIERDSLTFCLAYLAYKAVAIAVDKNVSRETMIRVTARYGRGNGPTVAGCLAQVVREDIEAEDLLHKNIWDIEGVLPKHIFTHDRAGQMW